MSDGGVNEGGWLIDDITVGGALVSDGSDLTGFQSPSEIMPAAVSNWNVKIIGLDAKHSFAWQFEFDGRNDISLGRLPLTLLRAFPEVVVIVSYDEPTERQSQYAPYSLTVNGVTQPGGGDPVS